MNMPGEVGKMVETVPLWIGGERVASSTTRFGEVTNPATGRVIRRVPFCTAAEVDDAVQRARRAQAEWGSTPPLRRARVMQRYLALLQQNAQRLAQLVTEENGKTLTDALGEVQRGTEVVEFVCGIPQLLKGEHSENVGPQIDSFTVLQPVGVCAGITPFNFPTMVPMWMYPPALACGNAFILKPSEKDPSPSVVMGELLQEAGLPDGLFQVVHGDREAVDALLGHPGVDAVSFVGSTPIARHVYESCGRTGKRVQALGGAKNHAVVLPDAELDFTVEAIIGAAYGAAGERCMAISAVVAVGGVADQLVEKIRARAARIRVGPGEAEGVEMGPLVTGAHRDKVAGYIDAGVAEGAKLVLDGRHPRVPGHENGFFVGTTLFDHVQPSMSVYRDEIFGPVLVVLRVDTLEEAIAMINANPYGNGAAVFTNSGGAARRFLDGVQIGMVGVNVPIPVPMAFYSFGGWKHSLFGDLHVHGVESVKFYTRTKLVTTRWPRQDTPAPGFTIPTLG
jgi:malonate-semialdehyde dehydrogenase (acetylating)/methylmalonate-semialdehyde dehydrogenase